MTRPAGWQLAGVVIQLLVTLTRPQTTQDCYIDLALLADGSGSICDNDLPANRYYNQRGCRNWEIVQDFLSAIVERVRQNTQDNEIALVTFANDGQLEFNFNHYNSTADIRAHIRSLAYPGGWTNTYEGLRIARERIFNNPGDRAARANVAIIVTDGKPTRNINLTPNELNQLQSVATVFAVGVTDEIDEPTLANMSSLPRVKNRNYFTSTDYNQVSNELQMLLQGVCNPTPPPSFEPICENADVALVVDSSGSIGESNFQRMRDGLAEVMRVLGPAIDAGLVRLSVILFSNNARVVFYLNTYSDVASIANAILSMRYDHGTTNTAAALDLAINDVFQPRNGDRDFADDVIFILTDGGSNDKLATVRRALVVKQTATLVAVGLGGWTDEYELKALATYPSSVHYWTYRQYGDLNQGDFRTRMSNFICNKDTCSNNQCRNGGTCVPRREYYTCDCTTSYGGVDCEYFCRAPGNVVFALDSSGSIQKDTFMGIVEFTRDVVIGLPVGAGQHVGLFTFSQAIERYFNLGDYTSKQNMLDAFLFPYYFSGSTDTATALSYFRQDMFTAAVAQGQGQPRVAVLITDGCSDDARQTLLQARLLREDGVHVLVVGIGQGACADQISTIASYPAQDNTFRVQNFNRLPDIVSDVRNAICNNVDNCAPNPCQNSGTCTDMINGYSCSCRPDYTGRTCNRACPGELDITFILDRSGSVRFEHFERIKQAMIDVINELEIWQDRVRVAVISFSDSAQIEFYLNTFTGRKQDIMETLRLIQYTGGRTNVAAALRLAREEIYQQRNGDRADVENLVQIYTDGKDNIQETETIPQAVQLRLPDTRVRVVAVVVSDSANLVKMAGIASPPAQRNIFSVSRISQIVRLTEFLVQATCNDGDECSSNPCRNGGSCEDGYFSYTCQCTSGFSGEMCQHPACGENFDLAVILDVSGSVQEEFDLSVTFIRHLVFRMDLQNDRNRMALVSFSDNVRVNFYLNTYRSRQDIQEALSFDRLPQRTNTQDALRVTRSEVLRGDRGDRSSSTNKVLVLTDGRSNINSQNTIPEAQTLKQDGAEIYVVAVGNEIDQSEIDALATSATGRYIYYVRDVDQARREADRFGDNVCQPDSP